MNLKTCLSGIYALLFSMVCPAQEKFDSFSKDFVKGYLALNIPDLDLSYVSGLQHIHAAGSLKKEIAFFSEVKAQLPHFEVEKLNAAQTISYHLIKYETDLNLERLSLEMEWINNRPATIPTNGIIHVPNGKKWYAYLLKRWVSDNVTPDQVYQFGLNALAEVKKHIEAIRIQTNLQEDDFYRHLNAPSFFTSSPTEVQQGFERAKDTVLANLHRLFHITNIPDVKIRQGTNKALAQTPGYYDNNTFYYHLFDKPYNKRQFDWLFIHEAIPGHHYQHSLINALTDTTSLLQMFFYSGFAEGWGAYAESLGKELGLYKTPYDELGRWEWDIVRSVRVLLDVALNYYGWTDEQALDFWKKNIRGQDDIAMREITRMRRWPAQVVTYKYGSAQIQQWKKKWQQQLGPHFNIKDFHDKVLNQGSLPLAILKQVVLND
jgi:uncharacterized protein (DUF885 family)